MDVGISHVLETAGDGNTEIGTWVNVIGYLVKDDGWTGNEVARSSGKGRKSETRERRQQVRLQAVLLWKAQGMETTAPGAGYERSVIARRKGMSLMASSREADAHIRPQ